MANLLEGAVSSPARAIRQPEDTWREPARAKARELEALLDEAAKTAPAFERQAIRLALGLLGAVVDQLAAR